MLLSHCYNCSSLIASWVFDYEFLADEWIIILQPYLNQKREALKRKKTVLNLSSLKQDYKKFDFSGKYFAQMLVNTPSPKILIAK